MHSQFNFVNTCEVPQKLNLTIRNDLNEIYTTTPKHLLFLSDTLSSKNYKRDQTKK